jgi:hypothetical protein
MKLVLRKGQHGWVFLFRLNHHFVQPSNPHALMVWITATNYCTKKWEGFELQLTVVILPGQELSKMPLQGTLTD